jgi:hypothetical protein
MAYLEHPPIAGDRANKWLLQLPYLQMLLYPRPQTSLADPLQPHIGIHMLQREALDPMGLLANILVGRETPLYT